MNNYFVFDFKKPKLSFISYLIGLNLIPFTMSERMAYEMPKDNITIKELWKWCKE